MNTYGQDFLATAMREKCRLSAFDSHSGFPPTGSLVVSQNPDSLDESSIIASLPSGIAVVIHVHCQYSFLGKEQQKRLARSLTRAIVGVTPAKFSTSELARRFPHVSWRTVYNGIDSKRFRPATFVERRSWRQERNIPNDHFLVGFVGRLDRPKGLQILEEFVRLIRQNEKIHLIIQFLVAKNADYSILQEAQILRALAPNNVTLFSDLDVFGDRPVRHFDALFTPSLSEVCPLVVLEAFNCGVPVIATRSTPFFSELSQFAWPDGYLYLQDLPRTTESSRSCLSVSDATAKELGIKFFGIAERMVQPDDNYRVALSESARRASFVLPRMLSELDQIYNEVEKLI